jgi:hypothetical protein
VAVLRLVEALHMQLLELVLHTPAEEHRRVTEQQEHSEQRKKLLELVQQ